jgi:hypothetical protein
MIEPTEYQRKLAEKILEHYYDPNRSTSSCLDDAHLLLLDAVDSNYRNLPVDNLIEAAILYAVIECKVDIGNLLELLFDSFKKLEPTMQDFIIDNFHQIKQNAAENTDSVSQTHSETSPISDNLCNQNEGGVSS